MVNLFLSGVPQFRQVEDESHVPIEHGGPGVASTGVVHKPALVALPNPSLTSVAEQPPPWPGASAWNYLLDDALSICLVGHGTLLGVSLSSHIIGLKWSVEAGFWEMACYMGIDSRFDTTRDDVDDLDIERSKFDSECVCVCVQSSLGSIVHTTEDIRDDPRQAANHDDCTFCSNQERREDLAESRYGEKVDVEEPSSFF